MEKSVKALLMTCTHNPSNGGQYFYKVSSRRIRNKEVNYVIPAIASLIDLLLGPSYTLGTF